MVALLMTQISGARFKCHMKVVERTIINSTQKPRKGLERIDRKKGSLLEKSPWPVECNQIQKS